MVAHIFELFFATWCYLAYIPSLSLAARSTVFGGEQRTFKLYSVLRNHARTVKRIIDTFLDAATFFALSVAAAFLGLAFRGSNSLYDQLMLANVYTLNLGTLYIVLSFSYRNLRRRRLRAGLISIISVVNLAVYTTVVVGSAMAGSQPEDFYPAQCYYSLGSYDSVQNIVYSELAFYKVASIIAPLIVGVLETLGMVTTEARLLWSRH